MLYLILKNLVNGARILTIRVLLENPAVSSAGSVFFLRAPVACHGDMNERGRSI